MRRIRYGRGLLFATAFLWAACDGSAPAENGTAAAVTAAPAPSGPLWFEESAQNAGLLGC